jgi:hypothetical protein
LTVKFDRGVDVVAPHLDGDQEVLAVWRIRSGKAHAESYFDRVGGIRRCHHHRE